MVDRRLRQERLLRMTGSGVLDMMLRMRSQIRGIGERICLEKH